MHPITPARLAWAFFLFVLGGVSLACVLCSGGCATVSYDANSGTLQTATAFKDITAKGTLPTPAGPVEFEVTSNTSVAGIKAAGEVGAAITGAAVKAAVKP